ncbi:MAG: heme-copper oxidase subunit III [Bacteroidota bacterium]|jgi:heme/copper-type cytochrome/quinol oxidase subunit 3
MDTKTLSPENQEYKKRIYKAEKMLVWLLTFSVTMVFAGLTSAYIIRKESKDWMTFRLPDVYMVSTAVLLLSSAAMIFTINSIKKNKLLNAKVSMLIALILGIVFCFTQYNGFYGLHQQGIYSLGKGANVAASFILVLTLTHVAHLVLAMIGMIWTFFKLNKGAYSLDDYHGLQLCATFWHYMDILWIYLFLFLYFIR